MTSAASTPEVLSALATFVSPFDVSVRAFAIEHASPALRTVALTLSLLGSTYVLGALSLAAGAVMWRRGGRRPGLSAVAAVLLSAILIPAIKGLVHRTRPPGALAFPGLGWSFPSGHALGSMLLAVSLAALAHRHLGAPRWIVPAAVCFSLAVGASRVCLDVHWASDVAAGWILGAVLAWVCVRWGGPPTGSSGVASCTAEGRG
jgi:membrane-associated phospholipid phosphatase